MFEKHSLLVACLMLLIALIATPAQASGKYVSIDLKFSGAFSNNVMHDPDADGPAPPTFSALVHTVARGSPGRAVVRGFGGVSGGFPSPGGCELEDRTVGTEFPISQNPLVITFVRRGSLLYGSGPGSVCVDFATGRSEFSFLMVINGGRGYFEGASGDLLIEGEAEPVGFDPTTGPLNLNAETGTIKGTAILH